MSKAPRPIGRERAQRIAKAHACENCGEYSYKRLSIKPATPDQRSEFGEHWHVIKACGVCGQESEMGIDADGEIVYVV
jgi:hypothetical protein